VEPAVKFVEGDVMTFLFSDGRFDVITVVASLHRLPLSSALERFRCLLIQGGVLAIIALYRIRAIVNTIWPTL
jgi:ubiquinone/menaquinone biosynthesis C-methylase UbiE